jgi:nitrite reductase/ring-hydroxylating ferredoxin subunit
MTVDEEWLILENIDTQTSKFPATALLDGEHITIFKSKTGFHAIQRRCPHKGADLSLAGSAGKFNNQTVIRCALHGIEFRASDGKSINYPGVDATVYETEEEDNQLKVRKAVI